MKYLFFTFCALALAACSGASETLGLSKKSPDEFQVIKRAPLALPPNYDLRPPRPGAPRPQEQTPASEARETIFGTAEKTAQKAPGSAGNTLLQKAGSAQIDPAIREKIDSEVETIEDKNTPVAKKLFGLGRSGDSASLVDAKAESERLQKNAEEGKPVTEGQTPVIEE